MTSQSSTTYGSVVVTSWQAHDDRQAGLGSSINITRSQQLGVLFHLHKAQAVVWYAFGSSLRLNFERKSLNIYSVELSLGFSQRGHQCSSNHTIVGSQHKNQAAAVRQGPAVSRFALNRNTGWPRVQWLAQCTDSHCPRRLSKLP